MIDDLLFIPPEITFYLAKGPVETALPEVSFFVRSADGFRASMTVPLSAEERSQIRQALASALLRGRALLN